MNRELDAQVAENVMGSRVVCQLAMFGVECD